MSKKGKDGACLKMVFGMGIVSKGIGSFPKQVQTHITDFTKSLKDPLFSKVSTPVDSNVKLKFDGDFFPTNIGELPPEMPDVQFMEVDDLIESDKNLTKSLGIHKDLTKSLPTSEIDHERIALPTIENCDQGSLRSVRVQCLESIQSLEKKCQSIGLQFNACDYEEDDDKSYDVDLIYAHKEEQDDTYYLVKWKNYPTTSNTWEPLWHLDDGCSDMIEFYHAMKHNSKKSVTKRMLSYFIRDLLSRKPYDILTLIKLCAISFGASEKYIHSLKLSLSDMKAKAKQILTFSTKKLKNMEEKLFYIMQYGEARKRVLIDLKEWENQINAADPGNPIVTVENNVDLERAPADFKFIQDYINTITCKFPEPVTFCSCEGDCYNSRSNCCPNDSEGIFAYSRYRKLVLEPGYPIFECNDKCSCPKTCTNRLVQHGQKVKVTIFRTRNKGWGLKAQETIEKGQFVLEYLGEIITSEVAEERGRIYDYVARSYLFDLDYGVDNASCSYTVDAGHVGNVAHFINHSCDPNLHVFAVWINQQDPNLPRLAFFAKRRISKGEELTFDYKMCKDRFNEDNEEDDRIRCRCGAKSCRKYLF